MYNDRRRQASLLIFFVLLLAALAIAAPNFFIVSNFSDILINTSFIAIAALGMMCVIVIGQIDVSVGAILAICCTLAGTRGESRIRPNPCSLRDDAGWCFAGIAERGSDRRLWHSFDHRDPWNDERLSWSPRLLHGRRLAL